MAKVEASAERMIDASADTVYGYLADMRRHSHFLPPAFSDFQVVEGGVGAGSVTTFAVTAGGRTRTYRMNVTEPVPGRTLVESDANSSLVTTFNVEPQGAKALVRIHTSWDGAGGIGGFFEKTFAPGAMRRIYLDELDRLNTYALSQQAS
jgi:Polyketide cyclase / dehydrase and lipid transport